MTRGFLRKKSLRCDARSVDCSYKFSIFFVNKTSQMLTIFVVLLIAQLVGMWAIVTLDIGIHLDADDAFKMFQLLMVTWLVADRLTEK